VPVPALQPLATKSGKSLQAVEDLWSRAKAQAEKAGHKEDFAYIMGILKRMLGLSEKFRAEDAVLLAEAFGAEEAGKIIAEGLPESVREATKRAWTRVEACTKRLRSEKREWSAFYAALAEVVGVVFNREGVATRGDRGMVGIV